MHLVYVTFHYFPERGAAATRIGEIARMLTERGHQVTIVAPPPHYPRGVIFEGYRNGPLAEDEREGVRILRTSVFPAPNQGFGRRLLGQMSFGVSSLFALGALRGVDAVMAEHHPLPVGYAGWAFARLLGAHFIYNVPDLWPEAAVELGAVTNPAVIRIASAAARALYRAADTITVTAAGQGETIAGYGIGPDKIVLLTNGADPTRFRGTPDRAAFRSARGWDDKFVVLYAGNHGFYNGLDIVVDAAAACQRRGWRDIRFIFVGDGAYKDDLVRMADARGLNSMEFHAPVALDEVVEWYAAADAGLVATRQGPIFDGMRPCKLFEIMAARRPVLGHVGREAAEIIARTDSGIAVPQGDAEALAMAVRRLADDPAARARMAAAGREAVEGEFSRNRSVDVVEAIMHGRNAHAVQGEIVGGAHHG